MTKWEKHHHCLIEWLLEVYSGPFDLVIKSKAFSTVRSSEETKETTLWTPTPRDLPPLKRCCLFVFLSPQNRFGSPIAIPELNNLISPPPIPKQSRILISLSISFSCNSSFYQKLDKIHLFSSSLDLLTFESLFLNDKQGHAPVKDPEQSSLPIEELPNTFFACSSSRIFWTISQGIE